MYSPGVFHSGVKCRGNSTAEVLDLDFDLFPVNPDDRGEAKAGFPLRRDLLQGVGVFVGRIVQMVGHSGARKRNGVQGVGRRKVGHVLCPFLWGV